MSTSTITRRAAAVLLAAGLLFGMAACGSSDGSDGAKAPADTTAPGATDAPKGDEASASGPCQWYTAKEMSALVGFAVTMASEEGPMGAECDYNSGENDTKVIVTPKTAEAYDRSRSDREFMDDGDPTIDHPGVGDDAWINNDGSGNPSVVLEAKKGTEAISVQVSTAGDAIADLDASIAIVDQIANKALGE